MSLSNWNEICFDHLYSLAHRNRSLPVFRNCYLLASTFLGACFVFEQIDFGFEYFLMRLQLELGRMSIKSMCNELMFWRFDILSSWGEILLLELFGLHLTFLECESVWTFASKSAIVCVVIVKHVHLRI